MGADYSLILYNQTGQQLGYIDKEYSFQAARTIPGGVQSSGNGSFVLSVGVKSINKMLGANAIPGIFTANSFIDYWILAMRKVGSFQHILLDTAWLVRDCVRSEDANTGDTYKFVADAANMITDSRYVMYYDGTSFSNKDTPAPADNMIKAIMRENFTALDGTRLLPADSISSSYFTVDADLSLAPNTAKDFSWRLVTAVIQEICNDSRQAGTALFYDIVPVSTNPLVFQFRTYVNQRGIDRGSTSGNPLEFSMQRGSLTSALVDENYHAEYNAAVAGGQGTGNTRDIKTSVDTSNTRGGRGPFSIREFFYNASSVTLGDLTALQNEADSALILGTAARSFSGVVNDARGARFGIDWNIGDKVVGAFPPDKFDCWINTIEVDVDPSGGEIIKATLSNVT